MLLKTNVVIGETSRQIFRTEPEGASLASRQSQGPAARPPGSLAPSGRSYAMQSGLNGGPRRAQQSWLDASPAERRADGAMEPRWKIEARWAMRAPEEQ